MATAKTKAKRTRNRVGPFSGGTYLTVKVTPDMRARIEEVEESEFCRRADAIRHVMEAGLAALQAKRG